MNGDRPTSSPPTAIAAVWFALIPVISLAPITLHLHGWWQATALVTAAALAFGGGLHLGLAAPRRPTEPARGRVALDDAALNSADATRLQALDPLTAPRTRNGEP